MLLRSFRTTYRLYIPHITPRPRLFTMATLESLEQEIVQQSALYSRLKTQNDSPDAVEEARLKLGELKKSRGALIQAAGSGSKDKKKDRLLLKTAKVRVQLSLQITQINRGIGHARLWSWGDVLSRTHRKDCQRVLCLVRSQLSRHTRI
jgi:hypothetical protein